MGMSLRASSARRNENHFCDCAAGKSSRDHRRDGRGQVNGRRTAGPPAAQIRARTRRRVPHDGGQWLRRHDTAADGRGDRAATPALRPDRPHGGPLRRGRVRRRGPGRDRRRGARRVHPPDHDTGALSRRPVAHRVGGGVAGAAAREGGLRALLTRRPGRGAPAGDRPNRLQRLDSSAQTPEETVDDILANLSRAAV